MTELLPALLCTSMPEFRKRIQKLDGLKEVKTVHIDIMDGSFVKNKTITLEQLRNAYIPFDIQVHLMALDPQTHISGAADIKAKEFIFHAEATAQAPQVAKTARARGLSPGLAINPHTRPMSVRQGLIPCDLALVMGNEPGESGHKLMPELLSKIGLIKGLKKDIKVGVDIGVHQDTAHACAAAGADFVAAASAIFDQEDVRAAIQELQKKLQ